MTSESNVYSVKAPDPAITWDWFAVKNSLVGEILMMWPNGRPVLVTDPRSGARYLRIYTCECGHRWAVKGNYWDHWWDSHGPQQEQT